MVQGGRREEGSGWGTRVHPWRVDVDVWQNQYNIVKLKNKIKLNLKNVYMKLALFLQENRAVIPEFLPLNHTCLIFYRFCCQCKICVISQ